MTTVPHYEEEYGDMPAVSLAAEFGREAAAGITDLDRLTPGLKRAVLDELGTLAASRPRTSVHRTPSGPDWASSPATATLSPTTDRRPFTWDDRFDAPEGVPYPRSTSTPTSTRRTRSSRRWPRWASG